MNIAILAFCMAALALSATAAGYSYGVYAANVSRVNNDVSIPTPEPAAVIIPAAEPVIIEPEENKSEPLPIPEGSISIPGFNKLIAQGMSLDAEAIKNSEHNMCYFIIAILLEDGTEVFRSGIIAPGQSIGTATLSHRVAPGEYENATARYFTYSLETMQPLNGADINFTLEVTA